MAALGYAPGLIRKIRVNPPPELDKLIETGEIIPVYTEQRVYRDIPVEGAATVRVSGKFDLVTDGVVQDVKNTTTYTYTHQNKAEDQTLQGSIYRWLDPERITADYMQVHYLFSDWQAFRVQSEKGYPPHRVMSVKLPLLSLPETEAFVRRKLTDLVRLKSVPEEELPECTDKELWRQPPTFKYYKNPQKMTRSTKNFDNRHDAYMRLSDDGNTGLVVETGGEVRACKYCPAFPLCTQKDRLIANGSLKID